MVVPDIPREQFKDILENQFKDILENTVACTQSTDFVDNPNCGSGRGADMARDFERFVAT